MTPTHASYDRLRLDRDRLQAELTRTRKERNTARRDLREMSSRYDETVAELRHAKSELRRSYAAEASQ